MEIAIEETRGAHEGFVDNGVDPKMDRRSRETMPPQGEEG